MPSTVLSSATLGIDAYPVHVEVDTNRQLPTFTVVGLPDGAVRESRERVMAALRNAGFQWSRQRVTVSSGFCYFVDRLKTYSAAEIAETVEPQAGAAHAGMHSLVMRLS